MAGLYSITFPAICFSFLQRLVSIMRGYTITHDAVTIAVLFSACNRVSFDAMCFTGIHGGGITTAVQSSLLLLFVIIFSAFFVAGQTVSAFSAVVYASSCKLVPFWAMCFSCVDCGWRVASQDVFTTCHVIKVLIINAVANTAEVITLNIFKIVSWCRSIMNFSTVNMCQFKDAVVSDSAVPVMIQAPCPQPAWTTLRTAFRDRAVLVNVHPEVFVKRQAGRHTLFSRFGGLHRIPSYNNCIETMQTNSVTV